jgi:hypothetical protein
MNGWVEVGDTYITLDEQQTIQKMKELSFDFRHSLLLQILQVHSSTNSTQFYGTGANDCATHG